MHPSNRILRMWRTSDHRSAMMASAGRSPFLIRDDSSVSTAAYSLLIVLKTVALSIKKWFPPTEKEIARLMSEDLKMHFLRKRKH
ncbi:hypothetical protein CEXT_520061 [Caerostris extrusa]|uniref:Uncharacterized protein n=1 Tax=Caerostris extrusa TaxID=172846 RepID=A0AAV4PW69_CAEEX|nr:hypothetical protein CEXT_520061 [Caerostris extrusa]